MAFFPYLALLSAGCSDFPRDPHGTLDQVRAERRIDIGLIAPLGAGEPEVSALIERLARRTGARPKLAPGDSEVLLKRLEEGELDLVIGRFDKKSVWASSVDIGPPLRRMKDGKAEFHLAPAMRNGENGWIALIEREVRDIAPEAQ